MNFLKFTDAEEAVIAEFNLESGDDAMDGVVYDARSMAECAARLAALRAAVAAFDAAYMTTFKEEFLTALRNQYTDAVDAARLKARLEAVLPAPDNVTPLRRAEGDAA
jgi:hypothetical protein